MQTAIDNTVIHNLIRETDAGEIQFRIEMPISMGRQMTSPVQGGSSDTKQTPLSSQDRANLKDQYCSENAW